MAQVHSIDGVTVNYVSQATWDQPTQELSLNLIQVHNAWRLHIWLSNVMTATEWATMRGKRGSNVTIVTTDPDDPNGDYVTYYGAIVRDVSQGRHESLNLRGVRVDFLVKV